MNALPDSQLLRNFAAHRDQAAFSELVRRHIDLVYSAAIRMVCDSHLAEDVTQGVFIALSANAAQLTDCRVLAGWLHRTAQNIAAQTVRSDVRRRAREHEAATMNEILSIDSDPSWKLVAPHLDTALGELSPADRDALLLRYFEKKSAQEMALLLGVSAEAAQKRVTRAIDHLRELFAKRGIAVGAGGLAVAISSNAVQAAPVGLAATVSAAALAIPAIAATTSIAATKAITMISFQKAAVAATITLLAGAGIYEASQTAGLRDQVHTLQQQQSRAIAQYRELQQTDDQLRAESTHLRSDSQTLQQVKQQEAAAADDPSQKAMLSWLDRVDRLKQYLLRNSAAQVPEMKWLTDQDWLNAASGKLDTDEDYRHAASQLRATSQNEFSYKAFPALQKYMNANNGAFPTDLSQLQPYFDSPIDPAILQDWQIVPASDSPNFRFGGDFLITQKSPVDPEMDPQIGIGPSGYGEAGNGFNPDIKAFQSVIKAYAAANPGQTPFDLSALLPYAATPAEQSAVNKQITMRQSDPTYKAMLPVFQAYSAANPGQQPKAASELLPYATTPAQQSIIHGLTLEHFPQ